MPENQCFLTEKGRAALERLMKKVYPGDKGLNKSKLNRDTKLARDTLIKIFNIPPKPVQKRCLENLFERLNARLKEHYREQNQLQREEKQADYEWRIEQTWQKECIPFLESYWTDEAVNKPKERRQHPSAQEGGIVPSGLPPQQQLVMHLQSLNYETGQAAFIRVIKQRNPARAFLVHVHDTRVHRWLVKRLEREVPCYANAKRAEVNLARLGRNFSESLWVHLAGQLSLPNETTEGRMASLSELCREKTVIIALSRFQKLEEEMQRWLIHEFWFPLVRRVRLENQQPRQSRLVLFLFEDGEISEASRIYPFEVAASDAANSSDCPVMLEPLQQISVEDVEYWFELRGFNLLKELNEEGEADNDRLLAKISRWDRTPWETLENICNLFEMDIADIEHYWKLTG